MARILYTLSRTGRILAGDGTAEAPGISFIADQDTGLRRSGNNTVQMITSGTAVAQWTSGAMAVPRQFSRTGIITPTALSGDVNNYAPTSLSTSSIIRQDGGAANRNVTGLTAQATGTFITFVNIGTTNNIVLVHESGSSTAANRFSLAGAANRTLTPGDSTTLFYDITSTRWRPV